MYCPWAAVTTFGNSIYFHKLYLFTNLQLNISIENEFLMNTMLMSMHVL